MSTSPRDVIVPFLPKNWSQSRRDQVADEIADALGDAGLLAEFECIAVEVADAMVPVETVEAYGLTIRLDANGEASEISHRSGLVTIG